VGVRGGQGNGTTPTPQAAGESCCSTGGSAQCEWRTLVSELVLGAQEVVGTGRFPTALAKGREMLGMAPR
jgi:hypothetical protein